MTRALIVVAIVLDGLLLWLPPGLSMLDARPYYAPTEALTYLGALGAAGRRAYAWHELVDFAFIATYTLLLRALRRRLTLGSSLVYTPAMADAIETGAILVLCLGFPSPALAIVASTMTVLKWAGAAYVVIVSALAINSRRAARTSPSRPP